ncbi:hypothetical protein E2C01_072423 [Portunus trituberculatus]|uniref:Retropepsins domain-containing protein n=1 Tax=Portunus trituberculatus TaxID=210409 RepID=A0A5B7I6N1_PORTR|nr:hypothetical protein [Portunus trituberculatus]
MGQGRGSSPASPGVGNAHPSRLPMAAEGMVTILTRDYFVDALCLYYSQGRCTGGKQSRAGQGCQTPAHALHASCCVTCRRESAPVIEVRGTVDGQPCQIVVDNGAEKTILRSGVIPVEGLPEAPQLLCGVTGHCAPLRGPVKVRLNVGGSEEALTVCVSEMKDPFLLGLDYLRKVGACVDLENQKLSTWS